jgi:stress-induced morphogen
MFSADRIHALLVAHLPDCQAVVRDDANDGEHFSAEVTSAAFAGLPRVRQHQLVYGALGDAMRRDIHALALKTYTPDEWRREHP